MMWEYATKAVGDAVVEGLSRVKRCTMEGRGAMAVDLQVCACCVFGGGRPPAGWGRRFGSVLIFALRFRPLI